MLRPVSAPRHFTVRFALALTAAAVFGEVAAAWVLERAYLAGSLTGWYAWVGDHPAVDSILLVFAKLLATGVVASWAFSRAGERWSAAGTLRFSPPSLAWTLLPFIGAVIIALSEIDNLMRAALPAGALERLDFAPDLSEIVEIAWLGPFLAVVIAPVTEEIVFRGLILRGLLGRWRPAAAIFGSAGLFALVHFNPAQAPVAVLLGLLTGWLYARTRSLGLCILAHALNNAASYLTWFPFEVTGFNALTEAEGPVFHPWWFDGIGLALLALGIWGVRRRTPPAASWLLPPPPLLQPPLLAAPPPLGGCQAPAGPNDAGRMASDLAQLVTTLARRARAASLALANVPRERKDAALLRLAGMLEAAGPELLAANARDLSSPEATALPAATRDRLTLTPERLRQLAESVRQVAALPDPVGEVLEETTRPNGLRLRKVRVPIGVLAIIYEARPNVTIDCAVLCLKSGNAAILRGGKEAFHTNVALAELVRQALIASELPADAVQLVPTTDRGALTTLLSLDTLIHCVIPRGGEGLIRFVTEHSTIPVIKHYTGVCCVYLDRAADAAMAAAVTTNAKVSRPSACNAAEQLLVHREAAAGLLPVVGRALADRGVRLRCDAEAAAILAAAGIPAEPAAPADFTAEFLDLVLAVRVVGSLDEAIATINRDGSAHSDAIVTADEAAARRFLAEVDSATVYWNASTRFTDGFEFGYGAEIGISTDRLHARGPMGLRELCSHKFLIEGTGQVRG
ncbi:MAG: glutamate-5-semialdehyde dehydrogenase [Verrucomicrobia bacterium]|nr:glutamate-5-semialdehyde dehydrogenase [Verrucomicrobiota bacterium]